MSAARRRFHLDVVAGLAGEEARRGHPRVEEQHGTQFPPGRFDRVRGRGGREKDVEQVLRHLPKVLVGGVAWRDLGRGGSSVRRGPGVLILSDGGSEDQDERG